MNGHEGYHSQETEDKGQEQLISKTSLHSKERIDKTLDKNVSGKLLSLAKKKKLDADTAKQLQTGVKASIQLAKENWGDDGSLSGEFLINVLRKLANDPSITVTQIQQLPELLTNYFNNPDNKRQTPGELLQLVKLTFEQQKKQQGKQTEIQQVEKTIITSTQSEVRNFNFDATPKSEDQNFQKQSEQAQTLEQDAFKEFKQEFHRLSKLLSPEDYPQVFDDKYEQYKDSVLEANP